MATATATAAAAAAAAAAVLLLSALDMTRNLRFVFPIESAVFL